MLRDNTSQCLDPYSNKPNVRDSRGNLNWIIHNIKNDLRDYPGSPVAKTPSFQGRRLGFNSWSGNEIPQAATKTRHSQISKQIFFFKENDLKFGGSPGGPVVKTLCCHYRGHSSVVKNPPSNAGVTGLIPGRGLRPHRQQGS